MMKPVQKYILIEPVKDANETKSGFVMPESSQQKPAKGKVLAVGADTEKEKCPVEVGQTIVHRRYGGQAMREEGKELILIEFKDVMAICK